LVPVAKLSVIVAEPFEFEAGDRVFHGLGAGAREGSGDRDLRRRDVGVGFDTHAQHRDGADQGDQDGDHPRKDGAVDKETRHQGSPY
jgi:hypothetical protein